MGEKNFFEAINSKTSFWLGFISGIVLLCAIGFFVMLGLYAKQSDLGIDQVKTNVNAVANVNTNVNTNPPAAQVAANPPTVKPGDHSTGPKDAPITFIEFSDIQCPYCGQFQPVVSQVLKDYPNQVRLVYKHFPLDSLHPNARPAAEASECVADQLGDTKFFAFLDVLYNNQTSLTRDLYINEAVKLGANKAKITKCIDDRQFKDVVEADYQDGLAAGVQGTPNSFINDKSIPGALPYASVKAVIDSLLKS